MIACERKEGKKKGKRRGGGDITLSVSAEIQFGDMGGRVGSGGDIAGVVQW